MKSMVSKTFVKVLGFLSSLFLTTFAGIFGFVSLACLVMSIINKDFIEVIGCIAFACAGFWCWSLRKEVLA